MARYGKYGVTYGSIHFTRGMYDAVNRYCLINNISKAEFIRMAIKEKLENELFGVIKND